MDESFEMMQDVFRSGTSPIKEFICNYVTIPYIMKLVAIAIVLVVLFVLYRIIIRMLKSIPEDKLKPQISGLIEKIITYLYYIAVFMYILGLFGIKFSAVWGAAGIAGIAIGFAAQTSVSNIISGLFIVGDHAMQIGDFITVGGVTGTVDYISLLSVKIHTTDNQLVRIPNSSIINNNLTNTTYYPIRRIQIGVSVGYDTDMSFALETLKKAPALCPTVLSDPAPGVWLDGFGESGINMTLAVWFNKADFLQTKNDAFIAVKKVFDEAHIKIPYAHIDVSIVDDVNLTAKK